MVQTYKNLLLILLLCSLAIFSNSCQKKVYPTTYPNKPGILPITIAFKEYRLKRESFDQQKNLNRADRKIKRKADRDRREELKSQKAARKKHISQQTPKVQARMKKSLAESEQTRKRKTFWDRIMFWKRGKSIDKTTK